MHYDGDRVIWAPSACHQVRIFLRVKGYHLRHIIGGVTALFD